MNISLSPFASENLVLRGGFGRPVPRQLAYVVVANPVRGHKEVARSTGHIMVTTRYSDQRLYTPVYTA